MAYVYGVAGEREAARRPVLRKISRHDILPALQQGLDDFREKPSHYIFLCLVYPIMGMVIGVWTSGNDALPLLFPLVTGFALVGPIAALGLYEISRRRERGFDTSWRHMFHVLQSPSLLPIIAVSLLLLAIFTAWLFAAQAIYDWIYPGVTQQSIWQFAGDILTTARGWTLLIVGNVVGFLFALLVLSISIVSLPMLLDRKVGAVMALETSVRATMLNLGPILLWGLLVAGLLFLGSLPLFVGLAVVLPVLGHATWHFYRKLVQPQT